MFGWEEYRLPMSEPEAPHIGHQFHLCKMCESGGCTLEQVKALVKDAKFICKKCGRTAVKEENLCEPVPL
jgi:transcription elongation factor Elf1